MMKKLILIPFIFLVACSGEDPAGNGGSGDEENSSGSPMIRATSLITKENAHDVTSFDNTPESVVLYFYASRIRGDQEWEKVCLPEAERSDRMKRKLEDYAQWNILQYKFVSKEEKNEERCYVTLWMEISINGKTDEGEDQAEVELINGKWIVTSVPT